MGDYYYLEQKPHQQTLNVVHRNGCQKLGLIRRQREFLGTFYAPADALLIAKKRYGRSGLCSLCCQEKR